LNGNNNNNTGTMTMTTTIANTGNLAGKGDVSSWPLMDTTLDKKIHYVWPQKGGLLDEATIGNDIIVDGIDCGKMSLEDSLEGDMQVLLQAPAYLTPKSMEQPLREGLQKSFLI
jgi:hypothetical protein